MSKLYDFLIELSGNLDLQRSYALDSVAVMKEWGLSAAEQRALSSGSVDEIYAVAGSRGLVICKEIWVYDPNKPPKKKKVK